MYVNSYMTMFTILMGIYGLKNNTSKLSKVTSLGLMIQGVIKYIRYCFEIDYLYIPVYWLILMPIVCMSLKTIPNKWKMLYLQISFINALLSIFPNWLWPVRLQLLIMIVHFIHLSNNGHRKRLVISLLFFKLFPNDFWIADIIESMSFLNLQLEYTQAYICNTHIKLSNSLIPELLREDTITVTKQEVKSRQPFSLKSLIFSTTISILVCLTWIDKVNVNIPANLAIIYWVIDLIANKRTFVDGYHHVICIISVILIYAGHYAYEDFNTFLIFVVPDIFLQLYLYVRSRSLKYGVYFGILFAINFIIIRTIFPIVYLFPWLYEKYRYALPFYPYHVEFHIVTCTFIILFLHWSLDIVISVLKLYTKSP